MNMKQLHLSVAIVTALSVSTAAIAADGEVRSELNAGADLKYNNNLFSQPNGAESWIEVLRAKGRIAGSSGYTKYSFTGKAAAGVYNDFSEDNYTDYGVGASMSANPSARHGFGASASYDRNHDARGSDDTAIQASPNEYELTKLKGNYKFGANSAKGRLVFDLGYSDKEYQNNRATTNILDYDDLLAGVTFYWKVAPKTSVLAQYRQTNTDYTNINRDSTLQEYLLGVTWEATAKTTGVVKIGQAQRDFDDSARSDKDSFSWEATVKWAPRSYSTFDLTTSQKIDNATATADNSIINTRYALGWNHDWSAYWSTRATASYSEADYNNTANRLDKTTDLGLTAKYAWMRDVTVSAGYTYTERDSNVNTRNYDRDLFLLSIDWKTK